MVEAAEYFKSRRGFDRFFRQLIKRYRSLGRIGGTVRLSYLTDEEAQALSELFRKDYTRQKSVSISIAKFASALADTRFAGVDIKTLIDAYVGEDVLTKLEKQAVHQDNKQNFFGSLRTRYPHPYCQYWLQAIDGKAPGTRGIHLAYDREPVPLLVQLERVLAALASLPRCSAENAAPAEGTYQRLSVFAYQITGNPHGFDLNTETGRHLVNALQVIRSAQENEYDVIAAPNAEEVTDILDYYGLIRDDVLNFVTCTGIVGFDHYLRPLPVWQAACQSGTVLNVPLREMLKVGMCRPASVVEVQGEGPVVFVVENSGVFSAVLDHFDGSAHPPMVCTHGQFRLAALQLLDKLTEDSNIYYSGDFDPEGLQMAQKLVKRYGDKVKLWHFAVEDYQQCLSPEEISVTRLQKLSQINIRQLKPVKDRMKSLSRAGYQEQLIQRLVRDIRRALIYTNSCGR